MNLLFSIYARFCSPQKGWQFKGCSLKFIKRHLAAIILAALLIVVGFFSLFIGAASSTVTLSKVFSGDKAALNVLAVTRLPRLVAVLLTGAGMSVAGLIMQSLCMNKFVSPTTGATISGAQLGTSVCMLLLPTAGLWTQVVLAFVFALVGTWIFVGFILKIKFKDPALVPLIGIMVGNVLSGITNFIVYKFDMSQQLTSLFTGSFSTIIEGNYEIIYLAAPMVVLAYLFANHFNIVGMGEDFSRNLGVNYKLILFIGLSLSAIITASVVVVVGTVSYLGLIIPNIVSMFKGDKVRGTLTLTALSGALFVLVCDIIARVAMPTPDGAVNVELPVELIIGIIGSVLFILTIIYRMKYGQKSVKFKLFRPIKGAKEGGAA